MGWDGLRLAVGTLTVLPSGPVGEIDRPVAGRAMLLAPIAVLPLAVAAAVVGRLAGLLGLPDLVAGLLVVGALAVGTRAMHLDGLADTVDGLGSGWDRERSLEIMRRGDVGPMGVVALVIMIGLQAAALGPLLRGWSGAVLVVVIICASRAALSIVCRRGVPAARPTGLGVAVAGSVSPFAVGGQWLAVLAVMTSAYAVGWVSPLAPLATGGATVAVIMLVRRCVDRLGGVTGDVMGAAVETTLTVLALGTLR